MSKPTLAFTRNWVVATLGDLGRLTSDYEIYALISQGIGTIQREMGKQFGLLKSQSITWDGSTGIALPDDSVVIPAIRRLNTTTNTYEFIDILDFLAIAERKHYGDNNIGYAYFLDRKLYFSWTLAAGVTETMTMYYFRFESDIDVTSTNNYDWTADNLPAFVEPCIRYYVLSNVACMRGRGQGALQKKLEWEQQYRVELERLTRSLIGVGRVKVRENRGF